MSIFREAYLLLAVKSNMLYKRQDKKMYFVEITYTYTDRLTIIGVNPGCITAPERIL